MISWFNKYDLLIDNDSIKDKVIKSQRIRFGCDNDKDFENDFLLTKMCLDNINIIEKELNGYYQKRNELIKKGKDIFKLSSIVSDGDNDDEMKKIKLFIGENEIKIKKLKEELNNLLLKFGNILSDEYFHLSSSSSFSSIISNDIPMPFKISNYQNVSLENIGNILHQFIAHIEGTKNVFIKKFDPVKCVDYNSILLSSLDNLKNKRTPSEKIIIIAIPENEKKKGKKLPNPTNLPLNSIIIIKLVDPITELQDDIDNDLEFYSLSILNNPNNTSKLLLPASLIPIHASKTYLLKNDSDTINNSIKIWLSSSGTFLTEPLGIHIGPKRGISGSGNKSLGIKQYGLASDIVIEFVQPIEEKLLSVDKMLEIHAKLKKEYEDIKKNEIDEINFIPNLVKYSLNPQSEKPSLNLEELYDLDQWLFNRSFINNISFKCECDQILFDYLKPYLKPDIIPAVQFPNIYRWADLFFDEN